jgi:hypothetical protein
MIRSMEGVSFASALELNMGYYHIKLDHDADAQKLCTIVFPWFGRNTITNAYPWISRLPQMFSKRHV